MARRLILGVLLGLWLLPASASGTVHIRIPRSVDPARLTIEEGSYAHGLAMGPITTKAGVFEYDTRMSGPTRLLLFAPGFKVVTAGKPGGIPEKFAPKFAPVPMVPVVLRFSRADGKAVAGMRVQVVLSLNSHGYFGYADGFALVANVGAGVTDAKGVFRTRVPFLKADSYFVKYQVESFAVRLSDIERTGRPWELTPEGFRSERSYSRPVEIRLAYLARIRGHVSKSFLQRNKVRVSGGERGRKGSGQYLLWVRPVEKKVLGREAPGSFAGAFGVEKDGSFAGYLRPGVYDLSLETKAGQLTKSVTMKSGVRLKEGEDRRVNAE
jgi:hypothetical protein